MYLEAVQLMATEIVWHDLIHDKRHPIFCLLS